jgi:acetyl/propionyl-CoA carboxylase alpha subunit
MVWLLPKAKAMQDFKTYLLSMRIAGPKAVDFYLNWVVQFYNYCRKKPGDTVSKQEIEKFLHHLSKKREDWQVDQASQAIKLYQFHEKRIEDGSARQSSDSKSQWKAAAEDMRKMLRLMHRSYRTEKTYLGWVRRFYRFLEGQSPYSLESSHQSET